MEQFPIESSIECQDRLTIERERLIAETPVLILAGGKGTRIRGITKDEIPKCLIELDNGQTYLDQLLDGLESNGFEKFILCLGFHSDQVADYLDNKRRSLSERSTYVTSTEDVPLGTAGALMLAIDRHGIDVPFLLVTSDAIFPYDEIPDLRHNHKPGTINWAVSASSVSSMDQYRGPLFEPTSQTIVQNKNSAWYTEERAASLTDRGLAYEELIDCGHGIIDPALFNKAFEIFIRLYPETETVDFYKDILPMLAEMTRRRILHGSKPLLHGHVETTPTLDMGTVERYTYANQEITE